MIGLGEIFGFASTLLEKLIPDKEERARIQNELIRLQQNGELRKMEIRLSAIVEEARSKDRWTSRARPSFMYIIYIIILCAIPMGILSAIKPDLATNITDGFINWIAAIPDALWATFSIGYLGYTGARSYDKKQRLKVTNDTTHG